MQKNNEKSVFGQLFEASTVGIQFVLSIIVGFFMGYGLDRLFGTSYLKFVFLGMGIIAGFRELFRVAKKQGGDASGRNDSTDDSKEH
ncbi:MAG TPA: AtpZ/AtpI family protein [Dissulfurispiraceae bacterium]|nr:AtpZ/AtpI family protein [Dissulfurispiraceae bacterium]